MRISGARGNDLFVLISGYFLINSSQIKIPKMFSLWVKILFYSVIVFCALLVSGLEAFSVKAALKSVMPITHGWWWFPRTYFVLYLIHPYLNILLHSFSRKDYEKFLIAIIIYWCIIPSFLRSGFEGSSLVNFMCLYSLAAYFRLWAEDFGNKRFILYGLLFIMADALVFTILDVIGLKILSIAEKALAFAGMMSPFTLLSALCLFLGFRKLKLHDSKVINIIASVTFGVYLLHENDFNRRVLWKLVFHTAEFQDSTYLIPYSITVITVVYIACTLIELLRAKIFKTFSRGKLS